MGLLQVDTVPVVVAFEEHMLVDTVPVAAFVEHKKLEDIVPVVVAFVEHKKLEDIVPEVVAFVEHRMEDIVLVVVAFVEHKKLEDIVPEVVAFVEHKKLEDIVEVGLAAYFVDIEDKGLEALVDTGEDIAQGKLVENRPGQVQAQVELPGSERRGLGSGDCSI
jgi:hypothetical protein